MVLRNASEYAPTFPSKYDRKGKKLENSGQKKSESYSEAEGLKWTRLNRLGYLYNGRKSASQLSADLLEVNLCQSKFLKLDACFKRTVSGEAVTMNHITLRVFDLDHPEKPRIGPEAVQFNCAGGTFAVFRDTANDEPLYVSHNAGHPSESDTEAATVKKLTYTCPDDRVTVWSHMDGTDADNPNSVASLNAHQEQKSLLINFKDVECAELTFAILPNQYRQDGADCNKKWQTKKGMKANGCDGADDNGGTVTTVAAYPFKKRSEGGNPLNGTLVLNETNFPGLATGPCPAATSGRNWLFTTWSDPTVAACPPSHPPPSLPPPSPPSPSPPPPSPPSPPPGSPADRRPLTLDVTPAAEHVNSTVTFIGGAVSAATLLALLFFASRSAPRALR